MQSFPHRYVASALAEPSTPITTSSPDLVDIEVDTPPEFGGPGGFWSPETLMMGAVANCFILTWRSIAAHNGVEWTDMKVDATGVLDRVDRVTRFTEVHLSVQVAVPRGTDPEKVDRLVHKTESACLITNSMTSQVTTSVELTEV